MNIEFQTAGFCITVLLMVLYISKANLKLYSQRLFLYSLFMTVTLLFMDILSIIVIKNEQNLPAIYVHYVGKVYIVLLLFEVASALMYILYDALGERKHRWLTNIILVTHIIEAAVVFALPIYTFSEGRTVYTYGPSTLAVYLFVAIDFVAILIVSIVFKKRIYPRRWFGFMIWTGIWITSAVVQFIRSELLLVGFATALGMIILYITLENPEASINQKLGCFNAYSLQKYLDQLYVREEKFYAYSFNLEKVSSDPEELAKRLVVRLKNFKSASIFKRMSMDFMLITQSDSENQSIKEMIDEEYKNSDSILTDIVVSYMENGLEAGASDKVEPLFQFYNSQIVNSTTENLNIISQQIITEFKNQEQIKNEIVNALKEDRVEVFFQPIFATHTNTFASAEALVRIRNVDGSLLSPGLFIPIAESCGLILELGERVFTKVCEFLMTQKPWQFGLEYVEVNLSVIQCEKDDLAQTLCDIMKQYKIDSHRINLEITETASISAKKRLLKNMNGLKSKGCTFSLDDFGKGESNLMYIVEMPVDILKLDFDITKAYHQSDKAKFVVSSVVNMAHDMGLSVVAEGIETKEELDSMLAIDIDYIQGFYFSKPLPISEFMDYLKVKSGY